MPHPSERPSYTRRRGRTPFDRHVMLERLAGERFDVLVVGGGITGVGVALDAVSRGLLCRAGRGRRLRQRDLEPQLEARPRRPALSPAGRRAARLRGAARAAAVAPQRPAPRQPAAVHDPDPDQGRPDPAPRRPGARIGDVDVRPDRRLPHRPPAQAPQGRCRLRPPAHDAPRAARRWLPVLRRHDRRRPAGADGRSDGRRSWRRARQPLPRRRLHQGRRRPGHGCQRWRPTGGASTWQPRSSSTLPACGPTSCARWRTATKRTRSGPPRASTSPCPGRRCATTSPSSSRSAATSAASSSCRGANAPTARSSTRTWGRPTRTTPARSRILHARPTTSPTCSRALNQAVTTGITTEDVTGVWAGLRPLVKSATSGRTADLSRRHRVTTGTAGVIADHGRQAHDLPGDGPGHRRRRAPAPRAARPAAARRG